MKYKPENFSGEPSDAGNMHNLFLQILLCNGVVGLVFFLLFLFYCLQITVRNVLRKKADTPDRRLLIALLSCLLGFGIISMVDNILIYPYTQLLNYLFFLFGLVCVFYPAYLWAGGHARSHFRILRQTCPPSDRKAAGAKGRFCTVSAAVVCKQKVNCER